MLQLFRALQKTQQQQLIQSNAISNIKLPIILRSLVIDSNPIYDINTSITITEDFLVIIYKNPDNSSSFQNMSYKTIQFTINNINNNINVDKNTFSSSSLLLNSYKFKLSLSLGNFIKMYCIDSNGYLINSLTISNPNIYDLTATNYTGLDMNNKFSFENIIIDLSSFISFPFVIVLGNNKHINLTNSYIGFSIY